MVMLDKPRIYLDNDANPIKSRRELIRIWRDRSLVVVRPSEEIKRISQSLQTIGVHLKDSLHVASAIVSQCRFFVTTDYRLFNKTINEITVVNPVRFIHLYEEESRDD